MPNNQLSDYLTHLDRSVKVGRGHVMAGALICWRQFLHCSVSSCSCQTRVYLEVVRSWSKEMQNCGSGKSALNFSLSLLHGLDASGVSYTKSTLTVCLTKPTYGHSSTLWVVKEREECRKEWSSTMFSQDKKNSEWKLTNHALRKRICTPKCLIDSRFFG